MFQIPIFPVLSQGRALNLEVPANDLCSDAEPPRSAWLVSRASAYGGTER